MWKLQDSEVWYVPKRYIVTLMSFLGLFNAFCMRVNLSVAIVVMVNNTESPLENNSYFVTECPALIDETNSQTTLLGERYNWDSITQGYILSAFFYGYVVTLFLGGYLAERFGPAKVFGISILLTSIFTLLTPVVVRWGLIPFIALRVLGGIGEGASFPSQIAIISRWSPKMERSRMTSIIMTGAPIGNVFSFFISGILSSSTFLGGWPAVFYVFGALGCIWYVFWIIFIYETPDIHPKISAEELIKYEDNSNTFSADHDVPWKSIATSLPFYAIIMTNIGHSFGFLFIMTEIPTYLNSVLHFNITSSGGLSALPHMADAVSGWVIAFIADRVRMTGKYSITAIRKIFNSIAGFGPSLCLALVGLCGCQSALIIFLLTFAMFLNGFKYSGFAASVVDMTPEFAGTIFGISNGIASLVSVVPPMMTGAIIASGATIANWSKVFYITAVIYFLTTAFYAIFGSAELQPWGKSKISCTEEDKNTFNKAKDAAPACVKELDTME